MESSGSEKKTRFELLVPLLIAIVSMTFAAASWRISMVSSSAGDASRKGILDAIKKQAYTNENWRQTYEEANYTENYSVVLAEVERLEASADPNLKARAANLRQYLLPNMQLIAGALAADPAYQKPDGTYDLQKRFETLQADTAGLGDLDPQASFRLAARYFAEQRWLIVTAVLFAISLFWLALTEMSKARMRNTLLVIGAIVYAVGLFMAGAVELTFFILRGGAL
jgi:hypothetical protein